MTTEIRVPTFGESVIEAVVGRWLKQEGDAVTPGEPLVELETEKVNTEVAADEAGVLARILRQAGQTVRPGDVLGTIEAREKVVGEPEARPTRPGEAAPTIAKPTVPTERAEEERPERTRISPVALRLAQELDVDLTKVHGTGPDGRITREDVEEFARRQQANAAEARFPAGPVPVPPSAPPERPTALAAAAPPLRERAESRERLSRRRLTIARRLVEAQQTAAMLTTFNEIDMSAVAELRQRRREDFRRATGVDLGLMSFFVKASIGALKAFPQINAELQGEDLVIKHYFDIGIAIGVAEGLVVPVLRDADRLSFAEIERDIANFASKAKEGTLTLDDLRGGTFTITNGGVFGSLFATPILNPPQVGILGMHKISERPVVVSGSIVARPMMYVALTYDHRVIDGREAVLFLVRIKELVEDPERLMLEG